MTAKKKLINIGYDDAGDNLFEMIREVVGNEVADHLINVAGGTRICLPPLEFRSDCMLVRFIGEASTKKIVDACSTGIVGMQYIHVPLKQHGLQQSRTSLIDELLKQDGMSIRDVALLTGAHMRTVNRRRAAMLKCGAKIGSFDRPRARRHLYEEVKGAKILRQLLLEGHPPSLLCDIMNIPGDVILTIRTELLRQGKLK